MQQSESLLEKFNVKEKLAEQLQKQKKNKNKK